MFFYGDVGAENSQHIVFESSGDLLSLDLTTNRTPGPDTKTPEFSRILKFVRKTISKEDITMYNFGLLDILEIVFPHHFQGKCPYFGP